MTFISLFNKSVLSLHEHAMYEHYASDYESVGPVYLREPLQDSRLILDNRLWRYNIDRTTCVMNHRKRQYITVVNLTLSKFISQPY